jgi:hypothetical protein
MPGYQLSYSEAKNIETAQPQKTYLMMTLIYNLWRPCSKTPCPQASTALAQAVQ